MPLLFIPNHGQTAPDAQFMVKGLGITALFEHDAMVYMAHGGSVRVRFVDASGPTAVEGVDRIAGEVNFLAGGRDEWRRGIPAYTGVAYREVYPGIDLMFSGAERRLKSEFLVAPRAHPARIGLEFVDADRVWVEDDGSLAVQFGRRIVHEDSPLIYQLRNGEQLRVDGSFQVTGNVARFSIGSYDKELPLVIDPVVYAILVSGSGADAALSLAVDNTGAAYITGFTSSFDLATINPAQSSSAGGNEVFVAKLNPAGNALVYCTFIGGRGDDRAAAIAVDSGGAAYVAGTTTSSNFPTRAALQPKFGGVKDAFVLKLNGAGNALVYSTYLGGAASDSAQGIGLDSTGNAYVAGDTASPGFPATGFQTTIRGGVDAFVAKISADGSRLMYSTLLGGGADEHAAAVAVDAYGQASVAGSTYSADYPTANAHQGASAGGQDAFLTKLAASGGSLVFSTYLGGSAGDVGSAEEARSVALDAQGNVYFAGQTRSSNFPVRNAAQATNAGWQDAFAAKFTSAGALVYSTLIGGANVDIADALAVDSSGSAHVGGSTTSANLMSLLGASGPTTGLYDGFIVKLTPAGNAASAFVLLGGAGSDNVSALALDAAGGVYAAGYTLSPTFPLPNGTVAINAGNYGAFIAKMLLSGAAVAVTVTPGAATLYPSQTQQFTATVANTANTAVTWSVTPAVGTISATGLYTAPATVASAQTVTVTATSVADPTKSATGTVALMPDPPPQVVSVSPSSGSGVGGTLTLTYSHPSGASRVQLVMALINATLSGPGSCDVQADPALKYLWLLNDAATAWLGPIELGKPGSLQNTQCVIDGAASALATSGNTITLQLGLTFRSSFIGAKTVFANAISAGGLSSGWAALGSWTVPVNPSPSAVSVSPSSGSGSSRTFNIVYSDPAGASNLRLLLALINATLSGPGSCDVQADPAFKYLWLLNDAATAWLGPIELGKPGSVQNSQCVIDGAASAFAASGNTVTLQLGLTFRSSFIGAKTVFANAINAVGLSSGWSSLGIWTVTANPSPSAVSVAPSSGSGSSRTFNIVYSDPAGASNLRLLLALINATLSGPGSCDVQADPAFKYLWLLNDAATAWLGPIELGKPGSLQNTQCVIDGAASAFAASGNTVTLQLGLTFRSSFIGAKTVFANAINAVGLSSGWAALGSWTVQ